MRFDYAGVDLYCLVAPCGDSESKHLHLEYVKLAKDQSIVVVFSCEHCETGHAMQLTTHKGETLVEWVSVENS